VFFHIQTFAAVAIITAATTDETAAEISKQWARLIWCSVYNTNVNVRAVTYMYTPVRARMYCRPSFRWPRARYTHGHR